MEITLKSGRKVGDGHPPYIIAEVGSNWRNLEDCLESIHQAKLCGADAVKFQLFTPQELYGLPDKVMDGVLNPEWLPALKAEADKRGIDFLCTAFSPEGYDVVNQYVDIHKVASSECCHLRILQKIRTFGKPVILSTGAKGVEDIRGAVSVLAPTPTILMYCVVAYPASEIDLRTIDSLKLEFKTPVGYSDHSTDVLTIPYVARVYGACVIEKHFKIHDMDTPDNPHSINPEQFKKMCERVREPDGAIINRSIGPQPSEKQALLRYNRRLIAIKDLSPGDELIEGTNFGIFRSLKDDARAAHPFMVDNFIGKRMKVSLKCGDGLWIEDVDA